MMNPLSRPENSRLSLPAERRYENQLTLPMPSPKSKRKHQAMLMWATIDSRDGDIRVYDSKRTANWLADGFRRIGQVFILPVVHHDKRMETVQKILQGYVHREFHINVEHGDYYRCTVCSAEGFPEVNHKATCCLARAAKIIAAIGITPTKDSNA